LQVAPQSEEGVSRAQRLQTSLGLLNRRINNLVSRGTQIAAQLTPMISTLTSHIQRAQQERIAENRMQMDQMVYLLLASSIVLVVVFLALVMMLYRRLVVRTRQLWLAVKDWQNGASPQLLPHGRDEIAQIGRLMLDITESRPLPVPGVSVPTSDDSLGILGHDAFVSVLGQVCDQAKETRAVAWLFLGRIHQCDSIFADYGSAVGSAVFQYVAKQWAFLGGAGTVAGCLNGRDLGLVVQGLSEAEAAALAAALWQMVSDRPISFRDGVTVPVRLLVGYDCCRGTEGRDLAEGLLARADNNLMKSKKDLWLAEQSAERLG
jgi:GGDEF domain-containing protein